MDLIWFSLDRAENKYSSTSFSLAKEIAKNHRLFYVDNPITYAEAYRMRSANKEDNSSVKLILPDNFHSIIPTKTLPINWLSKGKAYQLGSRFNNFLIGLTLQKLISDYALKDYIFVNVFNPFYGRSFSSQIKPTLKIYYSVDDIRFSPHVKIHGPRLEQEIVKAYDLTLTTSKQLQILLKEFSPSVYYLPNAADISLFKTASTKTLEKPDDICDITKPIIIYTGHVDWRVDIDFLKAIAIRHYDKVLLLVGPVSIDQNVQEMLKSFSNILFTGSKKLEMLPAYLQYSKCAIIPFKRNTLTKSIYPLKINEYLAAGLPVVSTNFSEDIQQFEEIISLKDDQEEFIDAIQVAIDNDNQEKRALRSKAAESNSWSARVDSFWSIINSHKLLHLK